MTQIYSAFIATRAAFTITIVLLLVTGFVYAPARVRLQQKQNEYYALSDFFDRVPIDKKVSAHALDNPYYFAAFIKVRYDSVFICGHMITRSFPNKIDNDSLVFNNDISGETWLLQPIRITKKGGAKYVLLMLTDHKGNKVTQAKKYYYRPNEELDPYLEKWNEKDWESRQQYKPGKSIIADWLNAKIIAGNYKMIFPAELKNNTVKFTGDGNITGAVGFSSYQVFDYSGTCRPGDKYDYIRLFDGSQYSSFIYQVKGDTLSLKNYYSIDCGYEFRLEETAYKLVKQKI